MKYRTIVVDPPWLYSQHWKRSATATETGRMFKRASAGRGAAAKYDCMTLEDIAAIPLGDWAEADAHLYLWTTNAFMEQAYPLARGWGFEPKTILTWCKPQIGMGYYLRNSTEHALFCVRGSLPVLRHDVPSHLIADRRQHSAKPEAFFDLVMSLSPGPYLDVFSRQQRLGWDTWGNECFVAEGLSPSLTAGTGGGSR